MTDFYNRLQQTALRLITQRGTSCTITSAATQGGFDPDTGQQTPDIPATTQQGVCAVLNYKDSLYNATDSLIQVGDKKLLVSAANIVAPSLNGNVTVLGRTYTIVAIKDLNPAGITLVYELHGRE